MIYNLHLDKKVKKFLLKHEDIARIFFTKVKILLTDPYETTLDIKSLKGEEKGNFRLRIGKYRFKYKIINQDIVIYFYDADSRGDIYK